MIDMPIKSKNIREITNEELCSMLEELQEEFDRREREDKEKDWLAVREAITNFIEKWGWITVFDSCDTVTINKSVDMNSIGDIDMNC